MFLAHGWVASEKTHKSQRTWVWTCPNLPVKNSQFLAFIFGLEEFISVISLMASVPVSPSYVAGEKEALVCLGSTSLPQSWLGYSLSSFVIAQGAVGAICATLTGVCSRQGLQHGRFAPSTPAARPLPPSCSSGRCPVMSRGDWALAGLH